MAVQSGLRPFACRETARARYRRRAGDAHKASEGSAGALAVDGRIAFGSGAFLTGCSGSASRPLRSCPVCKCPDESPLGVATAGAVLEAPFALALPKFCRSSSIPFPSCPCVQDRRRERGCPATRGPCCGKVDWQSGNGSIADFSIDTAINSAIV